MSRRGKRKYRKCTIGKGKFWDGVKNFFKKTKILSTAASLIPGVGPALGNVVSNVGYGRRRRRHRGGKMDLETFHKLYGKRGSGKSWSEMKMLLAKHPATIKKVISGGPSSCRKGSGRRHRVSHSRSNNADNRYIDNVIRVV